MGRESTAQAYESERDKESGKDSHGRGTQGRRQEGRQDLQDQVQPVPRRREGRQPQAGPKPGRALRTRVRHAGGIRLLEGEQGEGRDVERGDALRLLAGPEEVHSGHQDGFRGLEEAKGQSRPHRPLEEVDGLNAFIHSLPGAKPKRLEGKHSGRGEREDEGTKALASLNRPAPSTLFETNSKGETLAAVVARTHALFSINRNRRYQFFVKK